MKIKEEYLNKLKWFKDSPDAGSPECICSLCKTVISAKALPVRLWDVKEKEEIRFHEGCFQKVIE